jgi:hypothetical protein
MFCKLVAYTKKQLGQGFMNNGTVLAWLEFYACHKGKCQSSTLKVTENEQREHKMLANYKHRHQMRAKFLVAG